MSNGEKEHCFKYTEVFSNHFQFCGVIDNHNNKRHDINGCRGMSLEITWRTTRWELRVFAFILAVVE
eukprot:14756603-Ditylum_brightwellii.AAC.1